MASAWVCGTVGADPRPARVDRRGAYAEVLEAWRASCPRLPVSEEATTTATSARPRALVSVSTARRSTCTARPSLVVARTTTMLAISPRSPAGRSAAVANVRSITAVGATAASGAAVAGVVKSRGRRGDVRCQTLPVELAAGLAGRRQRTPEYDRGAPAARSPRCGSTYQTTRTSGRRRRLADRPPRWHQAVRGGAGAQRVRVVANGSIRCGSAPAASACTVAAGRSPRRAPISTARRAWRVELEQAAPPRPAVRRARAGSGRHQRERPHARVVVEAGRGQAAQALREHEAGHGSRAAFPQRALSAERGW